MLSAIMLISIYENLTWQTLITRMLSIGIVTFLVFYASAYIIIYFKRQEIITKDKSMTLFKTFVCGYMMTIVIFGIHSLIGFALSKMGYDLHLPKMMREETSTRLILVFCIISLLQYTFIFMIQNFTLSQYEKNLIEVQLLKLKSANAETTNALLRQQIQPHFLFNALNTLKSLIKKDQSLAEDYLIRLSDFLRASFSNQSSSLSTIAEELLLCSNYMEMQTIRFGKTIHYNVDPELYQLSKNRQIPTFSLQPLIENAIKHNIATLDKPLIIDITLDGDHVAVTNNIQLKKTIDVSTGKGLSNLKGRYKILSGDPVIISKTDTHFTVKIKIIDQ